MMGRSGNTAGRPLDPGAGLTERVVQLPDGRRIRTVVAGDGPGPLVVFEAGMSAPAAEWVAVQRAVSAHTPTLSYDRSGYGGSDDDPQPRTLPRMADDLEAVLEADGRTGPVVLVAHSWGGPIIRAYAHRNPERVSAVVLVDVSLAAVTATRKQVLLGKASFRLTALLARIGAGRTIIGSLLPDAEDTGFSEADLAIMMRDYATPRAMHTGVREMNEVLPARAALESWEQNGLPDLPVVALQGGRVERTRSLRRFRETFNRLATESMERHPQGRIVIVEGAGHLIPQEQPDAVVRAILDVI